MRRKRVPALACTSRRSFLCARGCFRLFSCTCSCGYHACFSSRGLKRCTLCTVRRLQQPHNTCFLTMCSQVGSLLLSCVVWRLPSCLAAVPLSLPCLLLLLLLAPSLPLSCCPSAHALVGLPSSGLHTFAHIACTTQDPASLLSVLSLTLSSHRLPLWAHAFPLAGCLWRTAPLLNCLACALALSWPPFPNVRYGPPCPLYSN